MVRFSDMLGGGGDPEDARPTTLPNPVEPIPEVAEDEAPADVAAEIAAEIEAAAEADPAVASPEDVLDRLTQYATTARAGDPLPEPEPAPEPASEPVPPPVQAAAAEDTKSPDDFNPVGDDLLPRGKSSTRRSKPSRKRRP